MNKLLIGSDTPCGQRHLREARIKPEGLHRLRFHQINFDKTINDLRDKRLLTFNSDKVTAVSVTSKGPAFEFGKNGQNEWQITKPKPYARRFCTGRRPSPQAERREDGSHR